MKEKYIKVLFEVQYDEDYIIKESVWAFKLNDNKYKIDNIPFYASGFACNDIVSAEEHSEQLYVSELIEASGNSTVRLLFQNTNDIKEVRKFLKDNGCDSEQSNVDSLIAVDIPFNISYKGIKEFLDNGEANEKWEYEEACISEKHQLDIK
ncbi:DUF4265 domain-containing protein [Chryseobacterium aquaticum]|uniref:DUF4265 domain-containing protein n=1 Tax=Chryseobacterium aquaticum TaxID=452084 RepID=UPI002FC76DAE